MNVPVPPHNKDAEETVLSAMMFSEVALGTVSEILRPGDFYAPSHGVIYETMLGMFARGQAVDGITVADELEMESKLGKAGGRKRVHEIAALSPATANVAHHAKIVRSMATLRQGINAGHEIVKLFHERHGEERELLDQAESLVYGLSRYENGRALAPISQTLRGTYQRLADLSESGDEVTGLPTGFRDLDRLTLGFQPGNLVILAARPGMGKSALALSMALNATERGTVGVFSLEMSKEEVDQRLLALRAAVPLQKLRAGKLRVDEWQRVQTAVGDMESLPLHVDDTGALTMPTLRSKARKLGTRNDLSLIVVDYLQLLTPEDPRAAKNTQVEMHTRALKTMAKDMGIPVLLLSQLNRNLESRPDKRPNLSDLRDSGAIEQDADLVLFIYRDNYYNPKAPPGIAELIVGKNRHGETRTVKLAWLRESAKFGNLEPLRVAA